MKMMFYSSRVSPVFWAKSKLSDDLYYWSADGVEFGMFPTTYAKSRDFKFVSKKLSEKG